MKYEFSLLDGGYGTLDDENAPKNQRTIHFNQQQPKSYCSNKISTSKYNVLTFLPKCLLEQFSKYANVFFLLIALLQVNFLFNYRSYLI